MDDHQSGNAKFVCPSDRQLLLRGRLKTGWCTGKAKPPGTLSSEEQDVIVRVIKRNEAVEVAERLRVGRLVDKLERAKERIVSTSTVDCPANQCRLCGQIFRFLRSIRVICADCKQMCCSKCSVDMTTVVGRGATGTATTTSSVLILCKVCSLTRELWKKSGAWFYKGIPKYDLPPQQVSHMYRRPVANIRLRDNETSSSEEEDDVDRRRDNDNKDEGEDEDEDDDDDDVLRIFSRGSRRKRVLDTTSLVSHKSQMNPNAIETQSLRSYAILGGAGAGGTADTDSIYSAASSCVIARHSSNDSIREASVGWLEVVLSYDTAEEVLHCSVIRARDLMPTDAHGLADPFCKLNIVNVSEGSCRHKSWSRTKTVHKTRNPEFNESITFAGVSTEALLNSILYIVLLDDDKYGHDFLGSGKVHLAVMVDREAHRISVPLESEDVVAGRAIYEGPFLRGQIHLALCYNTKKRALQVLIKECTNLISMDSNGFSDPFVKLHLKPDGHKRKFRTNIKWRNLNPIFNEEFEFETRPNDLDKQTLVLSVLDKDIGKSNDFLGSLLLGGASKGRRLKQWRDCIRLPDHYHEQWHCLASEQA